MRGRVAGRSASLWAGSLLGHRVESRAVFALSHAVGDGSDMCWDQDEQ